MEQSQYNTTYTKQNISKETNYNILCYETDKVIIKFYINEMNEIYKLNLINKKI